MHYPVNTKQLPLFTPERLPRRPYCTDRLADGVSIRVYARAIEKRYIQHNPPSMVFWMVFDLDWEGTYAWYDANLAPPHWTAVNPENGHCHHAYGLVAPVCRSDVAHIAPLRYLAAIEHTYAVLMRADLGYSGLLTKNPLHPHWRTLYWGVDSLYSLAELADHVTLLPLPRKRQETHGTGRNVALFDGLRHWSYRAIRNYWSPGGFDAWLQIVRDRSGRINQQFPEPLPESEVKSTARSVGKWTWRNITPSGFQALIERTHTPELQAERGRKATNQAAAGIASGQARTPEAQAERGRKAKNQAAAGIASGEARRLSREQERATARLLRAKGYTQQQIAAEIGVPQQTISRWLS
jgi:hypothetical protein